MKKSKIIVPALAMIGLSAVASVTGSVAWFTAQRLGSISTGNFAVVKTDGNLGVVVEDGIGTTKALVDGKYTKINPKSNTKITDASFNPKTKTLYTNANGSNNSFEVVGNENSYSNTTERTGEGTQQSPYVYHPYVYSSDAIYYAYTWTVTLSMDEGAQNYSMNVFFDFNASSMTNTQQEGDESETGNTGKAFRIAIISDSRTIVYAGLQNESKLKAVTGASTETLYSTLNASNGFAYFASDKYAKPNTAAKAYDDAQDPYTKANDSTANQTALPDYLGQLTYAQNSMTVTCVAWFEGSDEEIINGNRMEQVESVIGFYSTSVISQ